MKPVSALGVNPPSAEAPVYEQGPLIEGGTWTDESLRNLHVDDAFERQRRSGVEDLMDLAGHGGREQPFWVKPVGDVQEEIACL